MDQKAAFLAGEGNAWFRELWLIRGFERIYREDLPEETAVSVLRR